MSTEKTVGERPLRPGDVVEVKSAAEIQATLDGDGALDQMPFMPEMVRHAGRRYTVSRRVDKICDTVGTTGSRRMYDTVYLDDLRCDGSGHGRCQAACKIYWKEAWLRRVDDKAGSLGARDEGEGAAELERLAKAGTTTAGEGGDNAPELWRCQATEASKATEPVKTSNLWQYWREFTNGNFRRLSFIGFLARAFVMEVAKRVGLIKSLPMKGPGRPPSPARSLDLRAGDRVRVRTPAEIEATLDESGHNRGLSFDREMLPYCGKTFRVKDSVGQIIDESTGRMLKIPKDSLILEGTVCSGLLSTGRWFCPREIYPFWRSAWVEPVEDSGAGNNGHGPVDRSASEESMPRVGDS